LSARDFAKRSTSEACTKFEKLNMTISTILFFAITELILCLTPGPAVLLVLSQGILHGARKSAFGIMGILIGNIIYFSLSAIGLGVVLISSKSLFLTIRTLGALYLCYLGIHFILKSRKASDDGICPTYPKKRMFFQGLITQLSNPKAIVLFISLYPQFINIEKPAVEQFAIIGIISVIIEFQVLAGYAWLAERSKQFLNKGIFQVIINKLGGIFLIGAGIRLLLMEN
jgi:homoserine/homoserine lactone efflux protein